MSFRRVSGEAGPRWGARALFASYALGPGALRVAPASPLLYGAEASA
jgi:hypothetical protein